MRAASNTARPGRIPEQDLWGAVLLQVLVDLSSSTKLEREAAERWIGRAPSRDFKMVCELVDLEPGPTHRFLVAVIALPKEARRTFGNGEVGRMMRNAPREGPTPRVAAPEEEETVSVSALAKLVNLTPARIGQIVGAGRLDGCFELVGAHRRYRPEAACAALAALKRRGRGEAAR